MKCIEEGFITLGICPELLVSFLEIFHLVYGTEHKRKKCGELASKWLHFYWMMR